MLINYQYNGFSKNLYSVNFNFHVIFIACCFLNTDPVTEKMYLSEVFTYTVVRCGEGCVGGNIYRKEAATESFKEDPIPRVHPERRTVDQQVVTLAFHGNHLLSPLPARQVSLGTFACPRTKSSLHTPHSVVAITYSNLIERESVWSAQGLVHSQDHRTQQ